MAEDMTFFHNTNFFAFLDDLGKSKIWFENLNNKIPGRTFSESDSQPIPQ
jgi:hypothetical protein